MGGTFIPLLKGGWHIYSASNPGFTDISVNHGQPGAAYGSFPTSSIQNVLVYAGSGDDAVYSSATVPTEVNGQAGDDILNGGSANDLIRGGAGDDRINGRLGDDVLDGGDDHDRISGASGNDSIYGQGGNDVINGHPGNDFISAGDGDDIVIAGDGDDIVFGGLGEDNISGNAGEDELFGNEGNDRINGGSGNDLLAGREGDDSLFGQAGDDLLSGLTGDDLLNGGAGNDTLYGMEGMDSLFGSAGDDFLEGGVDIDADQLNGGGGSDTFINRDNDFLEDVSAGLDNVIVASGSNQGSNDDDDGGSNSGDSDDDFENLGILIGLFGPTLTGTVSGVGFNAAVQALGGVETFGNVSVLTVQERKFAFGQTASGTGVPGVGTQVTMVGSFPASLSSDFGLTLAPFSQPTVSTAHVIETSIVVVDAGGLAEDVAIVDGNGTVTPRIAGIGLPDFDVTSFIGLLSGGGSLTGFVQQPGAATQATGTFSLAPITSQQPIYLNGIVNGVPSGPQTNTQVNYNVNYTVTTPPNATDIRFVVIVRHLSNATDNPEPVFAPQQVRAITGNDVALAAQSGVTILPHFAIDRQPERESGFFGVDDGGTPSDMLTPASPMAGATGGFVDAPTPAVNARMEFEVVAVANGGADDGLVVGAATFIITSNAQGFVTQGPTTNTTTASDTFFEAVRIWNEQAAGTRTANIAVNGQLPIQSPAQIPFGNIRN